MNASNPRDRFIFMLSAFDALGDTFLEEAAAASSAYSRAARNDCAARVQRLAARIGARFDIDVHALRHGRAEPVREPPEDSTASPANPLCACDLPATHEIVFRSLDNTERHTRYLCAGHARMVGPPPSPPERGST
jgi:hypothetical protein